MIIESGEEDVDFFQELEEDLQSDNDDDNREIESKEKGYQDIIENLQDSEKNSESIKNNTTENCTSNVKVDLAWLSTFVENYNRQLPSNFLTCDPGILSPILPYIDAISHILIQGNSIADEQLLYSLNELSFNINEDIKLLHSYVKANYQKRFPELESLITNPIQFIDVIRLLESLNNPNKNEESQLEIRLEKETTLQKEQILVIIMSVKTSFNKEYQFSNTLRNNLIKASNLISQLWQFKEEINSFVTKKISDIAPNLCALIGPYITSLLVAYSGGLANLCSVPSCNLASIGKNKHLSHELHSNLSGVRQNGYLYNSELIQSQPANLHKQLLRILCAKVALASRVDAGQSGNNKKTDELGNTWKLEILEKINKLNESPSITNVKPLPIPEDKPKKKRSGRKFRKYKEQFKVSQFRQLQNRMEFGKREATVLDGTGEEVGLGMTNSSLRYLTGSMGNSSSTVNNKAKMSKNMKRHIQELDKKTDIYMTSLKEELSAAVGPPHRIAQLQQKNE
ncbi:hypothetical protein TBLA_0C02320 [Henningerozyma blattae CBS 6284]|uniref:Nop domain-containing protein n=1 Tax=Henningerozyma blattae (strain ATCC 34711 / CBS 6284 / DSM 70876 / NBRC 10599 / NRRL Y-10934 / UCD 77-7) TaxID=1071380 RepID=I2H0Z1_HENB6|nr:hypothetical protein TBLA_0C02320 [Tetrapisispora blattae CBS 6284]CCH60043.1 hypothetical protein TBLA_0C02320 [Tetrapisispora blattae CBS 6284]